MDVSLVIVNWNTRDLLRDCLASIYDKTRQVSFEVIVVDNASTDGSVEMVRAEFPRVRLLAGEENLGFAAGNNQGMSAAEGKYFLLLNPDTVVLEGAIDKSFAYAEEHPDVAVVGCKVLSADGGLQGTTSLYPGLLNLFLSTSGLAAVFPNSRVFGRALMWWWDHNDTRPVDYVAGCFMLVRRRAVEQAGVMDERYFMYAEEIDWCRRFTKAGWKVVYFHDARIVHLLGRSSKVSERDMQVERRKSTLKYFYRNRGALCAWAAAWLLAAGDLLRLPFWCAAYVAKRLAGRDARACAAKARSYWRTLSFHLVGVEESTAVPHTWRRQLVVRVTTLLSLVYYAFVKVPLLILGRLTGKPRRELVVLYYHGVYRWQRAELARQMEVLLRAGTPVVLGQAERVSGQARAIAVSFDDAFANLIRNALPELAARRIPATIFVPAAPIGATPTWVMREGSPDQGQRVMSEGELKSLGPLVTIGSHTVTHRRLGELSDEDALWELAESKKQLESALGRPVRQVAFPHGNFTARTIELAREAGYQRAYTIYLDTARQDGDEFVRGRYWGDLDGGRLEHWLKVRGGFEWLGRLQRLKERAARRRSDTAGKGDRGRARE